MKDEYIIIVGCGRLGANLAALMCEHGKSVVIVDKSEESFKKLPNYYSGFNVEGDAIDIDVLNECKIKNADVLVAVTNDDNTNIMVAQIAKEIFKVPNVVSRLYDLNRENIYKEFGIKTICPSLLSVKEFESYITHAK